MRVNEAPLDSLNTSFFSKHDHQGRMKSQRGRGQLFTEKSIEKERIKYLLIQNKFARMILKKEAFSGSLDTFSKIMLCLNDVSERSNNRGKMN